MDEAGGDVAGSEHCGRFGDELEQAVRAGLRRLAVQMLEAISGQLADIVGLTKVGQALERADADMAVAQPG